MTLWQGQWYNELKDSMPAIQNVCNILYVCDLKEFEPNFCAKNQPDMLELRQKRRTYYHYHFLQSINFNGQEGSWIRGHDYFRLDGSTKSESRETLYNSFNDGSNKRARYVI